MYITPKGTYITRDQTIIHIKQEIRCGEGPPVFAARVAGTPQNVLHLFDQHGASLFRMDKPLVIQAPVEQSSLPDNIRKALD